MTGVQTCALPIYCFHCWNQHSLGYPKRVGFRSSAIHLSTFNAFSSVDAEEGEANAYAIPGTEASLDLAYTIVMPIKKEAEASSMERPTPEPKETLSPKVKS